MENMPNGILILLFLCTIFICQFHFGYTTKDAAYSSVTCLGSERRALLEFKESLVDSANRLASWTTGEDCCSWDGITCNHRTGHVEKLDLRNPIQPYLDQYSLVYNNFDYYGYNCLGGEPYPSLLNLEHLSYLDLSCNNFSGIQIPIFLGSLKNLRYLNLTGAGFGGEIPPHLGNLSNLQYLSMGESAYGISDNSITAKSLNWIAGLPSLKALDLSTTNITESVDWLNPISMLPSLSSLKLKSCRLVSTVSPTLSLTNLTSLVSLDLGDNYLNSAVLLPLLNLTSQLAVLRLDYNVLQGPIPVMSKKLSNLTVLDLSVNFFNSSSILEAMCNQTSLISMNLSFNQLEGSLPLCLGNLTSLRELCLTNNTLGGNMPSELGYLRQLTTLDLSSNYFKSSIPSNFEQLTNLKFLHLHHNMLYGTVPSTLGQLTKLQEFDISDNSLTGELSESHFALLKSLKLLAISRNYFLSFIVSSQWVPPFQLRVIRMDSVLLGSRFPPWLQTQKNVVELRMNNVSISSVIPVWFTTFCSSIKTLYLSKNNIHGSLISFPPYIRFLDLSNNFLSGRILLFDANYGANVSLAVLKLDTNDLIGNIPDDLCNFLSLQILSLANNQLKGRIPLCFGNLRHLKVLDLANNSFSGHVPSTLGSMEYLELMHLNGNNFYGILPSSLKNLKSLKTLDLGDNQLMDIIPKWIGKELSSLQFLRLQSNNFYGDISIDLCQLPFLQVLNLAKNNLVGHLPRCFGNLSMMQSNDFSPLNNYLVSYIETLWNIMKGVELEYTSNLQYAKLISLSGNNLSGEIPSELLDLEGLQSLNLSNNKLSGRIRENIGNLRNLESLDLSMNQLSGPIPQSLASIDNLGYLNLSFNNLVGQIPPGNHFDTFNNQSIYEGNSGLCGKPLAKSCPNDTSEYEGKRHTFPQNIDDEFEVSWFFAGMAPGFVVGLLGVFCILCFKKSWRQAYFGFVENIYDTVWVAFTVKISKCLSKFN